MKKRKLITLGMMAVMSISSLTILLNSCTKEASKAKTTTTDAAVTSTQRTAAAAFESCTDGQYWVIDKYVYRNNYWGYKTPGAVGQCVWANSIKSWGCTAGHQNNTGGVKGYPQMFVGWVSGNGYSLNSNRGNMGKKHQAYSTLKVYWNSKSDDVSPTRYLQLIDIYTHWSSNPSGSTLPRTNIQLMTYWNDPTGWFDNSGTSNMTYKGQKTIDGITYKAWFKSPHPDGAAEQLIQIRPTTKTRNATHNIKAICAWLVSLGVMSNDEYMSSIQAGWELIDGNNWNNRWETTDYSVTAN